ncbi:MAG TPA: hypothetical protein PK359_10865, partial [Burkholderiaceae bacterium]|nr:hypothetical protein [Burkholderiaceae bacterium]
MMVIRGALLEYTIAPVWGFRETPVQAYLDNQPSTRFIVRALPGTTAIHPLGNTAGGLTPPGAKPPDG